MSESSMSCEDSRGKSELWVEVMYISNYGQVGCLFLEWWTKKGGGSDVNERDDVAVDDVPNFWGSSVYRCVVVASLAFPLLLLFG